MRALAPSFYFDILLCLPFRFVSFRWKEEMFVTVRWKRNKGRYTLDSIFLTLFSLFRYVDALSVSLSVPFNTATRDA